MYKVGQNNSLFEFGTCMNAPNVRVIQIQAHYFRRRNVKQFG